jgi:hypothetical protein
MGGSKSVGVTMVAMAAIAAAVTTGAAAAGSTEPPSPSHEGEAAVELTAPADFDHVAGAVPLTMSASGITIEPAGESHEGAGHFHVIADAGCLPEGESIIKDPDHVHFGQGQSEGVIYLEPGRHELCLQVGDGIHLALGVTDTVTIDVGINSTEEWCTVVEQLDDMFLATDTSDDEFSVKQLGYANIGRLIAQLQDGLEYVDPAVREDLDASLVFVASLVDAMVAAPDAATADQDVSAVFESAPQGGEHPGDAWILEQCGVAIDD